MLMVTGCAGREGERTLKKEERVWTSQRNSQGNGVAGPWTARHHPAMVFYSSGVPIDHGGGINELTSL